MAISTLTFVPPVRRPVRVPPLDYELFEQAVALFEQGEHLAALERALRHVLPGQAVPPGPSGSFTVAQGSSRVSVGWDEGELTISVPLVRLPPGGGTAAMRYLLGKLSGSGQLHQPRLRGDDVLLEYREKLARLHPGKLAEVLRRAPVEADDNDDWMVDQFGVTRLEREPVEPLAPDELERADFMWRTHWSEVEELLKEVQRKRSVFFLDEVTAYTVYRLRHGLPLSGSLSARLAEAASTFNDSDCEPAKREAALAKIVKGMKAVSPDELAASLGHVHYCISPLGEGTPRALANYLGAGNYVDAVEQARSSGRVMDAAVALVSTYYYLLARLAWPEAVETGLQAGLEQASGKPWREAATLLASHGKSLVASYGADEESDESGAGARGDGDEPDASGRGADEEAES